MAQVPRWLICPCGSAGRSACVIPGFLTLPVKTNTKNILTFAATYTALTWRIVILGHWKSCCLTLCCSSFLWRTLAVSSWARWRGISSLRAISALWSQAPITPRGTGRDLSRWMCQSSSCNWHVFKKSHSTKGRSTVEKANLIKTFPHVHKQFTSLEQLWMFGGVCCLLLLFPPILNKLIQLFVPHYHWQWVIRGTLTCISLSFNCIFQKKENTTIKKQ